MFSIIIPAYNEENAIKDTLSRCFKIIKDYGNERAEIIVVDDGSSDKTAELAKAEGIKLIRLPHNIGYGSSLKTGITEAVNDIIIITDADGTYPLETIPELITEYKKGFDMVIGARKGKYYNENFLKRINRYFLKLLVEFTAGRKIPDINSGLRVFSKNTASLYFDSLCNTFSFTTSMTLAYMMTGKFVSYIPITYEKRTGQTKVKLFKDSLRTLQYITEAILFYNPLKIFIVFSILLFILSSICLVIALFTELKIMYIVGAGSLLIAIIMFGFGLISVQIKQLISQLNKYNH